MTVYRANNIYLERLCNAHTTTERSAIKVPEKWTRLCWQDETLEHEDKYYYVFETPIKDKSMLGTHGQELCDNLDVHWMIQTCGAHTNSTGKCTYTVGQKKMQMLFLQ